MLSGGREIELVRRLGAGGFGEVYLANLHGRDRFVRRVAVKLLLPTQATPDAVNRARDEARLLGMLEHDNIVQVLELTEINGQTAVVMEYVQGVDIAGLLTETGTIPLRAALEITRAAASALDVAWNSASPLDGRPLRVIHRDIKPANILVTAAGGTKVLDFGIARGDFDRDAHTRSGLWGTPRFMPPELLLSEGDATPAVDTYALGVTLLDMLNGGNAVRIPLGEQQMQAYFEGQLQRHPPDVQALLRRLVARQPEQRPSHKETVHLLDGLIGQAEGESLSRFAARVVPPILEQRQRQSAPAGGGRTTLDVETLQPPAAVPATTTPAYRYYILAGLGLGLVALLLMGILGILMFGALNKPGEPPGTAASPPEATPGGQTPAEPNGPSLPASTNPTATAANTAPTDLASSSPTTAASNTSPTGPASTGPNTPASTAPASPVVTGPTAMTPNPPAKKTSLVSTKPPAIVGPTATKPKGPPEATTPSTPPPAAPAQVPVITLLNAGGWTILLDNSPVAKGKAVPVTVGEHHWEFVPPEGSEYQDFKPFPCKVYVNAALTVRGNLNSRTCSSESN